MVTQLTPLAHAATYIGYNASNQGAATCGTNCSGPNDVTAGTGEIIKAPFAGQLLSVGLMTGSALPNRVAILTFQAAGTPTSTTYGCGSAGTCAFANTGQSFTLQDFEIIGGLSPSTFSTINLANPVTVANGQWVAIVFMLTTGSGNTLMTVGASGQTSTLDTQFEFSTTTPSTGTAFNTIGAALAGIVGGSFAPTSSTGSTITQCYGNCGSPAITLLNTNSTHMINWNASLTLFYEFQSNLNGFVNNVTFSLAAAKIQNPQVIAIGVYTIPSCTNGFIPFSQSCPGSLVGTGNTGLSATKGKFSLALNQGAVTVSAGQWVGIALSATIQSCCDVNDTNTAVPIFQTVGGVPSIITSSTSFNPAFKMGLWAFITGQTIGVPATGPGSACVSNFAQIDCLLPALVQDFCNVQTTACLTTSALVWTPILAIIFLVITLAAFSTFSPGVKIGFREAENVFLIFLLIVVFMMTDQGLLPVWVDLFFFMVVAVMFGKQVQGKLA